MDVARFAAELPGLFDDFPGSELPSERRFRDVIDGIPHLATENVLTLINLAGSLLGPGESYVEVGTFYGASLIAAMRGNVGDFVGVDSFMFRVASVRGRKLPPASRAGLEESLRRFDGGHATILEGDAFEVVEGGALGDRRIGVYYWDGPHDYDGQLRGLHAIEPWLADEALVIVDDMEWENVNRATTDYLAEQPKARLLFDIPGEVGGLPQWWDGVAVLGWQSAAG